MYFFMFQVHLVRLERRPMAQILLVGLIQEIVIS